MSWRFADQRRVNSQTPKVLKKKDIPSIAQYIKSKDCKNIFLMVCNLPSSYCHEAFFLCSSEAWCRLICPQSEGIECWHCYAKVSVPLQASPTSGHRRQARTVILLENGKYILISYISSRSICARLLHLFLLLEMRRLLSWNSIDPSPTSRGWIYLTQKRFSRSISSEEIQFLVRLLSLWISPTKYEFILIVEQFIHSHMSCILENSDRQLLTHSSDSLLRKICCTLAILRTSTR